MVNSMLFMNYHSEILESIFNTAHNECAPFSICMSAFGERPNMTQTSYVKDPEAYFALMMHVTTSKFRALPSSSRR